MSTLSNTGMSCCIVSCCLCNSRTCLDCLDDICIMECCEICDLFFCQTCDDVSYCDDCTGSYCSTCTTFYKCHSCNQTICDICIIGGIFQRDSNSLLCVNCSRDSMLDDSILDPIPEESDEYFDFDAYCCELPSYFQDDTTPDIALCA